MARNQVQPHATRPPGPGGHWLLGNIPEFRRDPLGYLEHTVDEYGDVVELRAGPQRAVLLRHPDDIQHVLQTNHNDYPKRSKLLDRLGLVLGEGLVNSEGHLWRRQRTRVAPFFHSQRIKNYTSTMVDETRSTMDSWEPVASEGGTLDVCEEMMGLAFRVVGKTLFGADMAEETSAARESIGVLEQQTNDRFLEWLAPPLWVPTKENRSFRQALEKLDGIVLRLIERSRREPSVQSGIVGALVEAAKTDPQLTDKLIRDETVTLLLAGHENTGNAIAWVWYMIMKHPDVLSRIERELSEVLGGRPPRESDVASLEYTRMVVDETLRLYPPGWMMVRNASKEDRIRHFHIASGSWMLISQYLVHRHPEFWPDPYRFDPERFSKARRTSQHPFSYIPFGAGPRKCLGARFATIEMVLVIASIVQRYRLHPVFDGDIVPEPFVALAPRGGLPVRLECRVSTN